jgi:hypothetical protein
MAVYYRYTVKRYDVLKVKNGLVNSYPQHPDQQNLQYCLSVPNKQQRFVSIKYQSKTV